MGEKRKPVMTTLLKIRGKKTLKIELFRADSFNYGWCINTSSRYRLRVGGKWWSGIHGDKERKGTYFTKTEIKEIIFKNIQLDGIPGW